MTARDEILLTLGSRRGDEDSLSDAQRLTLAVVRSIGEPIEKKNLISLVNELIDSYGSANIALDAVKNGDVSFSQDNAKTDIN